MNKRSLGGLAIVLIAMMAIVSMAGLDRLPRDVKRSVEVSASRVKSDRTRFNDARAGVNSAIGAEPELFRTQAALWQARLLQADEKLKQTEAGMARLLEIEKANKRGDAPKLEEGIRQLEAKRAGAVEEALNLRSEADRWLGYKRNLPQQISEMKSNYEAVHGFDIAREASAANKAMTDWPSKKADLESRTRTLEVLKQQAEEAWTSTAEARAKAESNNSSGIDYSMLFAAGEAIRGDLKELQRGTATMNALASQLYVGRDKVLLDIDDDHGIKEKVRIVETKYTDAALSNPQPTSKEVWEDVDSGRLADLKKSIGMVVERKPPGKYDSEVEKTLQAPGYAYIAPPGQANQYGGWNNGVWSWLPQYLIMSQLLRSNHGPMTHGDYYGYDSARRRGQVWYGNSGQYGGTWSRGSGTSNQRGWGWGSGTSSSGGGTVSSGQTRSRDGWNTGGSTYGGSRYESKGSYGGSRYQSRPGSGSGGSGFGSRGYSGGGRSFGRGFGRGGRR